MTINKRLQKNLKKKAHHLKPIIIIGSKGLTEAVQLEIERALLDHELVKIKINAETQDDRKKMIDEISQAREAELIHTIGHVAVIYRENED